MNTISTRVSALPPGTDVVRVLMCQALSGNKLGEARRIAEEHFVSTPQVAAYLKAAVGASTTTSGGAPLPSFGIHESAFALLQSVSILGRLAPRFRTVPFRVKVPRELGSGTGAAWHGEGLAIPLVSGLYDNLQQNYYALSAISVVTRELFKLNPVAEATLRVAVPAGAAKFLDQQLLDPSVSATAGHPASLTNGAAVVTSTGSSASQIVADLASLLAEIKSPGDGLAWIMRPLTYYTIAAKLAGAGMPLTPGFLLTIPVVLGSTSPQQITLLDCAQVAYSSDGTATIDASSEADVQMDDTGTQDGTAGTGSTMVSLLQTNMVAVRVQLGAAWQHTAFNAGSPSQPAGVAFMTVAY